MTDKEEDMNVKIQSSGAAGGSGNSGSCGGLANYINHEDKKRKEAGLKPLPYTTPDGKEVTTEEVIAAIDANTKGLTKNADKFFHIVVSPSREEIQAMGSSDQEVYESGLKLIKGISDAYAQNFNRKGLEDSSDLELFWKPHFTRGKDGDLQFHIHGIVSRKTKCLEGLGGKQLKISPLTNHRETTQGAVQGGFDRTTFIKRCEKLFDKLFQYNRRVAETFDYQNAMKHGTTEEKAEQAERLVNEGAENLKASITAGIERRRMNQSNKQDIEEIVALLDGENINISPSLPSASLDDAIVQANIKNTLLSIFANAKDKKQLGLRLVAEGYSFYVTKAEDVEGIEDLRFIKRGKEYRASELMNESERNALLDHWHRLGGLKPAYKIREQLAQKTTQKPTQKKFGGPKIGRR